MSVAAAAAASSALSRYARAETAPTPLDLDVRDIVVPGDAALGRRFALCIPKHLAPNERAPLLILLHGLGETGDERAGAFAWLERYGLGAAYDRLRRPPIRRTTKLPYWTDAHLDETNAALAKRPFSGLVIACPYTPNVARAKDPSGALDRYAQWIVDEVIPRARRDAPVLEGPGHVSIDGCSMGGYVGLEVFLRKPEAFNAWGGVQSAFGAHRAAGYADRLASTIARVGPRPIHIETSEGDPFRDANIALADALQRKNVPCDRVVLPGPHDQPWLREIGTIEMLRWHA